VPEALLKTDEKLRISAQMEDASITKNSAYNNRHIDTNLGLDIGYPEHLSKNTTSYDRIQECPGQ
jgi:hypothetical protein